MKIGFAGDVMIGRMVDEKLQDAPPAYVWGDLLSALNSTSCNIVNLETALTLTRRAVPKVFNFKSHPEHVLWLKEANISLVNLANNHLLDYSEQGLLDTLTTL